MFFCVFAAKTFHSVQFRVRRVIIPCIRRQNSLEARVSNAVIIGISTLSDILFTAFLLKNQVNMSIKQKLFHIECVKIGMIPKFCN